jgi:hypothetical protein
MSDLEGVPLSYGPGRPGRSGFLAAGAGLYDEILQHTAGRKAVSGGIHD